MKLPRNSKSIYGNPFYINENKVFLPTVYVLLLFGFAVTK